MQSQKKYLTSLLFLEENRIWQTFISSYRASLKMYFGQRFHTPNEISKEYIQFLNITQVEENLYMLRNGLHIDENVK